MARPFYYAIFVNSPNSPSHTITTGTSGADGDLYANGAVNLLALSNTVNGELESTSTVTTGGLTVAGSVFENTTPLTMPSVTSTNYSTASGVTTIGTSLNGYTFTTGVTGTQLLYAPTDLSLRGSFRNKGTIFVNGDVTVINSMSYFNSSSRLTVIATGSITFNNPNVVGYWNDPSEGPKMYLPGFYP